MSMRSPLGHARGMGSTKSGTEHWYVERLQGVALAPLTVWFVISMIVGVGSDYESLQVWLSAPGTMVVMILYIIVLFWHAQLGISVVIHDYVHNKTAETISLIAVKFVCCLLGVFLTIAVIKIGLGG